MVRGDYVSSLEVWFFLRYIASPVSLVYWHSRVRGILTELAEAIIGPTVKTGVFFRLESVFKERLPSFVLYRAFGRVVVFLRGRCRS